MSSTRSITPPPPHQRIPQTPKWAGDDFAPYTPRKSARLSQLSHVATTPRRQSSRDYIDSSSSSNTSPANSSTPSSPQTAKKRLSRQSHPEASGRRISGALTRDSTVTAASALGLPPPKDNAKIATRRFTATGEDGLLPTPAKTPTQRPEGITPAVKGVARNLFAIRPAPDEVMPTPKKGRRKYTGFTLDSFGAEEESAPIQIYTDSTDRVPEVDNSPDNPFYGKGKSVPAERTKRSSKRRKVKVEGEDDQYIEDLEDREDGLVYVFRGRKTFRKFTDPVPEPDSETDEPAPSTGRLTRSSMKPRLLFPERPLGKDIKAHTTEDEEADTDIEEHEETLTPTGKVHGITGTPKAAPKFTMYTPPTTARATRSMKLDLSGGTGDDDEMSDVPTSPMLRAATRISRSSPFEEWSRGGTTTRDSKKRATEATSSGIAKKARQ